MTKPKVALRLEQLSHQYKGSEQLSLTDLSFAVKEGEIVAVVGESGSGKTSLLRLIAGLERPKGGVIHLGERVVASDQVWVGAQARGVGLVFQEYALFPHMTVGKNVGYGLYRQANRAERVKAALQLVELEDYLNRYPHELSGGEQQRVAIARALAPQPPLLLLDEPFSNLNESLKNQVRNELVAMLHKAGIAVLLVTHDMRDAFAVADRVLVIRDGILQQYDSGVNIYQQPQNAYVARLAGPVNLIPIQAIGEGWVDTDLGRTFVRIAPEAKQLALRPEQFEICSPNREGSQPATVLRRTFQGNFTALSLQVNNTQLEIHVPSFEPPAVDNLHISLRALTSICAF